MEALTAARRALPPGGLVPRDYVFDALRADGAPTQIKLSELFAAGKDSLAIYNMMFPRHKSDGRPRAGSGPTAELPIDEGPCPSCGAFLDQLDGVARHVRQVRNFAVVAKASPERIGVFARHRG
ncbi:MAG: DUF899 family protein [Steroidobacteraceae bacterium]